MADLYLGIEEWLVAERQFVTQPDLETAYLSDKAAMLNAILCDPTTSENVGAAKARSHIGQCERLIRFLDSYNLDPLEETRVSGLLAAKALKVATGYSMRAGYFHPTEPANLYRDRMVLLVDDEGSQLPALGMDLRQLETTALDNEMVPAPQDLDGIREVFDAGDTVASVADYNLLDLLLREKFRDPDFSGSELAQMEADELTVTARGLFLALAISAINLQGDEGPDGLGPIILEPKSDKNAKIYLRINRLVSMTQGGLTFVSSANTIPRGNKVLS